MFWGSVEVRFVEAGVEVFIIFFELLFWCGDVVEVLVIELKRDRAEEGVG